MTESRKPRILHISANFNKGAGQGAYMLHRSLLDAGVSSRFLTLMSAAPDDETVFRITDTPWKQLRRLLLTKLDTLPTKIYRKRKEEIFSTGFVGFDITKSEHYQWADIIHLHWINHGMVSLKKLQALSKPLVWTLRDMWPFTGGCHHAFECRRYETTCGECPHLKSSHLKDLSYFCLRHKEKVYMKRIQLVAISSWLRTCAASSRLFSGYDIKVIHNGVETKHFYPEDILESRRILGLPGDSRILLLGATDLESPYKGLGYFMSCLDYLERDKYFLAFFGRIRPLALEQLEMRYKAFGMIDDMRKLRALYSSADVFVAPSVAEAFGKTLVEAMACGTPVVCFDAVGPKDIVEHHITGYRAKFRSSEDLAKGIEWVLNNMDKNRLASNCQQRIRQHFAMSTIIVRKYIELYRQVLKKAGAGI